MAASVGGTSVTPAVRAPPPSYYDAISCSDKGNNNKKASQSLELVTFPKDKCQLYPVFLTNKNGTDIRLPPALYYHRNSDPLLHRRSQAFLEEFGEFCQSAKTKRRQSVKDFFRHNSKSDLRKNCILNHSSSSLLPKNNTLPFCNGGIKNSKRNGTVVSNTLGPNAKLFGKTDGFIRPNTFDLDSVNLCDVEDSAYESPVLDEQKVPRVIEASTSDLNLKQEDGLPANKKDTDTGDIMSCVAGKHSHELKLVFTETKDCTDELDEFCVDGSPGLVNHVNTCNEGENISDVESVIIKVENENVDNRQHSEIDYKDVTEVISFDDTEVKNVNLQPRVLCNGTLITSNSDQDLNVSESQPFLSRDDSVSGSDSNYSVKQGANWQRPRPMSSLSNCSGDNTGSLPGSLERHSHVVRNDSGTGSESNCSVKPSLSWSKNRPVSALSSRSCSPQPGPSGYNEMKDKRASGKKTVTYSDTVGNFTTVASCDSSHSINFRNAVVGEESLRQLDDEIEEIERVGKKADRGTIYCACGILGIIIGVVLIFVYFI